MPYTHPHDKSVDKNSSMNDWHDEGMNGLLGRGDERPQQHLVPQEPLVHVLVDGLKQTTHVD